MTGGSSGSAAFGTESEPGGRRLAQKHLKGRSRRGKGAHLGAARKAPQLPDAPKDEASTGAATSDASAARPDSFTGKYGERGWRRLPLSRGGLSRLTFRASMDRVELYAEGVQLESLPWANAGGVADNRTASPAGLSASIVVTRHTKLFYAWHACDEWQPVAQGGSRPAAGAGHRSIVHACSAALPARPRQAANACVADLRVLSNTAATARAGGTPTAFPSIPFPDRTHEWRHALRLPVSAQPLLLPSAEEDPRLTQSRFIRYRSARCGNEVMHNATIFCPRSPHPVDHGSAN